MAAVMRQQLLEKASHAEKLLEQLRPALQKLREETAAERCRVESEKLRQENNALREQVQLLVQRLNKVESTNGAVPLNLVPISPPDVDVKGAVTAPDNAKATSDPAHGATGKPSKGKTEKKSKPQDETKASEETENTAPVDVSRLLLKVGRIVDVKKHPDADSLYVETVDLAEERQRTIVSGLVKHVPLEQMQNRLAVFLCNLKPAKMRGVLSEGMIMCASTPEVVRVIDVPAGALPGDRVTFGDYPGEPDTLMNPKKKIWETVQPDLKINSDGVATYKGSPFTIVGKGVCSAPGCANFPIK